MEQCQAYPENLKSFPGFQVPERHADNRMSGTRGPIHSFTALTARSRNSSCPAAIPAWCSKPGLWDECQSHDAVNRRALAPSCPSRQRISTGKGEWLSVSIGSNGEYANTVTCV